MLHVFFFFFLTMKSYKDPCAKPEMVVPITPLLVMMGVKQYLFLILHLVKQTFTYL